MFKILIVEDDKELNQTVCMYLNQHGYKASGVLNANDAYDEFAKTVRELDKEIPILFMTAREDFESKRKGFHAGIDDYMIKPIDLDELLLRIEALLRRSKIAANRKMEIGALKLDVYMTKLRDKFSECTDFEIVTVHGLGYKAVLK